MTEFKDSINPGSAEEFVTAMQLRFQELAAAHQAKLGLDEVALFARSIGGTVTHAASIRTYPQQEQPTTLIL